MHIVKLLSIILVAVYLILEGLLAFTGFRIGPFFKDLLGLVALGAGILILISLTSHTPNGRR